MQELLSSFNGTLDAIITDPPYGKSTLALYGELAALAAKALKPSGVFAIFCGQSYLPQILYDVSRQLDYRWVISYEMPARAVRQWQRRINSRWKPVLLFARRDAPKPPAWVRDTIVVTAGGSEDKDFHCWGQSVDGVSALIEALTQPGELVCDPLAGGGTTGVAAVRLGRRFVGCDTDEDAVAIARARLAEALREHEDMEREP